jgi:exodeoxyribonuclease VIII
MTEATHLMIDLETLGTEPFAPIVSIGACTFYLGEPPAGTEPIADCFYQVIDVESSLELGMRPSGSTLKWWMQQSDAARAVFDEPQAVSMPVALDAFTDYVNSRPLQVWGNSARFDCGLLAAAYKACNKELPWQYWNERCYRTVKNLPGANSIAVQRVGTHHNALDDAITQALHLRSVHQALGLVETHA